MLITKKAMLRFVTSEEFSEGVFIDRAMLFFECLYK